MGSSARVDAGDLPAARRRQPRRHRVPKRTGAEPGQYLHPDERHGKPAKAMKACESALAIRAKLAEANPTVPKFQCDLAASYNTIGVLLSESGRTAEELKKYRSALAILTKLAEANPTVTSYRSQLAVSYNNIGEVLRETGNSVDALRNHESALAIQQRLADGDPTVTRFQGALADSHVKIGLALSRTGKKVEALRAFESALAMYRKLADANPAVVEFQSALASSYYQIGLVLSEMGQPAAAIKAYANALTIRQKLAAVNPDLMRFQRDLADTFTNTGPLLIATNDPGEALKAYESALAIRRKLARDHPDSAEFASGLGATLNNLALIDLASKRFEEARILLREAIDGQRKALASNLTNRTYRLFLANHWTNMIHAARALGDPKGVAEAERELAELYASDPTMVALDARLSAISRNQQQPRDNAERLRLAQRAYDKALHATAAKLWADALDSDPKLAEDRQAQHRYNAACAAALAGCGQGKDEKPLDGESKAKLREQARGWLQAELASWTKLIESGPAAARPFVAQTLKHWQEDTDLSGVREVKAVESLPEAERKAWHTLWANVNALLAKAQNPLAPIGGK